MFSLNTVDDRLTNSLDYKQIGKFTKIFMFEQQTYSDNEHLRMRTDRMTG